MRVTCSLFALALLGTLALLPDRVSPARADAKRGRSDIMPLSEIRPKMKGYGLTVFEGTRPERFEVEVIDVLRRFLPKQDLILIRTRHPRLDVAKVVAGMSGSPIYIDGKMIGAYAYGWTFAAEPIAGVTPIENMISDLDRPIPREIYGWSLGLNAVTSTHRGARATSNSALGAKLGGRLGEDFGTVSPRQDPSRYIGSTGRYDLLKHAEQVSFAQSVTPSSPALRPVSTPLMLGGTSSLGLQLAEKLLGPLGFEPMQAGGDAGSLGQSSSAQGTENADARFEDGGAIGVQLVRGDTSAMGLGTVTRVEGDRLVAFGHPMMQAGATALPTALGKVLWFLASEQRSFKIGMAVKPLGALVADRQASIVVSQTAKAPVISVRLDIEGVEGQPLVPWRFEVAHEKFLTPSFLSMALASAIQSTTAEKRDVSWSLDSDLVVDGLPNLTFEDFGVAVGGMPAADDIIATNIVEATGALLNNPWEPVRVVELRAKLKLRYAREIFRLRGAELLEREIDAGEPARIKLRLIPYDGPEQDRIIVVPIDKNRAGETLSLEIVPGYTENREMAPAENLRELANNLDQPVYLPKSLVVKFTGTGGTVVHRGRVAAQLPASAVDLLTTTSIAVNPATFAATTRSVHPLPFYVLGRDRVSVVIRPVLR